MPHPAPPAIALIAEAADVSLKISLYIKMEISEDIRKAIRNTFINVIMINVFKDNNGF